MTPVHEPCRLLEWDSEFFGFRIARAETDVLTAESASEIVRWCRDHAVVCLYFLARPDDSVTTSVAESEGFHLVDARVTLERSVGQPAISSRADETVLRPAYPDDRAALRAIARRSHRDSRFYADPLFPREKCDLLYETWIERSCDGWAQAVLVAELRGAPCGYVTCHVDGPERAGRIGLVGVESEGQGQGVGTKLILGALGWFEGAGVERLSVVTQLRNVRAQRLYQRCGFITGSVALWYHKWFQ